MSMQIHTPVIDAINETAAKEQAIKDFMARTGLPVESTKLIQEQFTKVWWIQKRYPEQEQLMQRLYARIEELEVLLALRSSLTTESVQHGSSGDAK